MKPLISVCVPTYNSALTLGDTLVSILGQSYANLEILVVDNASSDHTIEVAKTYEDHRIKIFRNVENIGAEGNFNRCIELASGKYTAIFHADDIYTTRMVAEQVEFLENHPEVGGVLTEAEVIDELGADEGAISFPSELKINGHKEIDFQQLFSALLRHSNFLICPSAMVRTSVYKREIKSWRSDLFGSSADLDIWIRIAKHAKLGLIAKKLMKYRVYDSQYSARVRNQTERADFFRVIDYYLEQDYVRKVISSADINNYQRLIRRDIAMRAANLLLIGDFSGCELILKRFYTTDVLISAIISKRGLVVFLLFIFIKLVNRHGLRALGQTAIRLMKRNLKK